MNIPAKEAHANFSKLPESVAHSETPVVITKQGFGPEYFFWQLNLNLFVPVDRLER